MNVAGLLEDLQRDDFSVSVVDLRLRVMPAARLTPALRAGIMGHKAELLFLLTSPIANNPNLRTLLCRQRFREFVADGASPANPNGVRGRLELADFFGALLTLGYISRAEQIEMFYREAIEEAQSLRLRMAEDYAGRFVCQHWRELASLKIF